MRAVFRAAVWAPILITTSTLVATVRLVDVTAQAGISFTHINGARVGLHIPETMGSGGGFLDYDGDGNLDL